MMAAPLELLTAAAHGKTAGKWKTCHQEPSLFFPYEASKIYHIYTLYKMRTCLDIYFDSVSTSISETLC